MAKVPNPNNSKLLESSQIDPSAKQLRIKILPRNSTKPHKNSYKYAISEAQMGRK
jgi:hypothetical protein